MNFQQAILTIDQMEVEMPLRPESCSPRDPDIQIIDKSRIYELAKANASLTSNMPDDF